MPDMVSGLPLPGREGVRLKRYNLQRITADHMISKSHWSVAAGPGMHQT